MFKKLFRKKSVSNTEIDKKKPEEIFNDIITGENTTYFIIGKRVFPHPPRTDSEIDEVAKFIVSDIYEKIISPLHLIQYITCEIDGANQSDHQYARDLRDFSNMYNYEFEGALGIESTMDEEDSALSFMDSKISPSLQEAFPFDEAIRIRCLIVKKFITTYQKEINEMRMHVAKLVIENDLKNLNYRSAEKWQKVIDEINNTNY